MAGKAAMTPTVALRDYLTSLKRQVATGVATEHTYRPALKAFVEALAQRINAINEAKRIECGAPDFTVTRQVGQGIRTVGYIEAKDIGTDLAAIERDSERVKPATPEGKQLKRYRDALDNLILTDYLEFRWYAGGERRGHPAYVANREIDSRLAVPADGGDSALSVLTDFLAHHPQPIARPKELAERLARLTHLIRDIVVQSFERGKASDNICSLRDAFAEVLIPDLDVEQFADMFAQTLAYGLFAACIQHDPANGPFKRASAAHEIPKTNPFLRRLFDEITGVQLDDEPFAGLVDDLAQLLAETDMSAALADFGKRSQLQDPVVHFYQTYLAAYDPNLREMRGVYYTPEPVVSYIVQSVDHLLRSRFACTDGMGDTSTATYQRVNEQNETITEEGPRVLILDPACGTGTFLYSIVDLIRNEFIVRNDAGRWSTYVRDGLLPRLFGFELLMAPYAVAHLKLGMQLAALDLPESQRSDWAYDFSGDERLGVYLTNTLEEAIRQSEVMLGRFISDEANAAAEIKRDKPVLVVLGNPPYSGHSANKGQWIRSLVDDYKRDYPDLNKPAQAKWLQDDYVKFIRFGQWRINQTGAGVLAFINNHSYLDNPTFRGMREQLLRDFSDIYVLQLHGDSRKGEIAPDGTRDENVFDIQQGVAIGIFVKESHRRGPAAVRHAHLWGTRENKYAWLSENNLGSVEWTEIRPTAPFFLFTPQDTALLEEYDRGWKLTEAMNQNGDPAPGLVTTQDQFAISWTKDDAEDKVERFLLTKSEEEARRLWRLCSQDQWNYDRAKRQLRSGAWKQQVMPILYRPFDVRWTVYDSNVAVHRRDRVMHHMLSGRNVALVSARSNKSPNPDHSFCTRLIMETKCGESTTQSYLLPLYLYPPTEDKPNTQARMSAVSPWPEGENGRRPNFHPDFVHEFEHRLGLTFLSDGLGDLSKTFGPEDAFHYIYAVFHSPEYRRRYGEFLKVDFPRVPLTSSRQVFQALAMKGAELVELHLLESPKTQRHALSYPVKGDDIIDAGHPRYLGPGDADPRMKKSLDVGRVYISKDVADEGKRGQYFEGVSPDVWRFSVGGYQVCEKWLKDRRGRALTNADLEQYDRIVGALAETIRIMNEIDTVIEAHGGWPIK